MCSALPSPPMASRINGERHLAGGEQRRETGVLLLDEGAALPEHIRGERKLVQGHRPTLLPVAWGLVGKHTKQGGLPCTVIGVGVCCRGLGLGRHRRRGRDLLRSVPGEPTIRLEAPPLRCPAGFPCHPPHGQPMPGARKPVGRGTRRERSEARGQPRPPLPETWPWMDPCRRRRGCRGKSEGCRFR